MIYRIKKNKTAFTLVEILVSVFIVIVILLAMSSIFRSLSSSRQKIAFSSALVDDLNYFLKIVSENIREAEMGDGSLCDIGVGNFFQVDDDLIYFIKDGECHYFEVFSDDSVDRLVMYSDSKDANYITSQRTNIIDLKWEVEDAIEFGQPLVTVAVKASTADNPDNFITAQTSVSIDYYE